MYKVINQPDYIPKSAYLEELDKYIGKVSQLPGIVGIYNFGSIECPGLSDLDILVVIDDEFLDTNSHLLATKFGLSSINGKNFIKPLIHNKYDYDNRLFLHGPMIVHENELKDLNHIAFVDSIEHLYGRELMDNEFIPGNLKEFDSLKLMYLVDFVFGRIINYSVTDVTGVIDKRSWITRIWSLRHSIRICSDLGIELSDCSKVIGDKIVDSRYNWQTTKELCDTGFVNFYEESKKLANELFEKSLVFEAGLITGSIREELQNSNQFVQYGDKRFDLFNCSGNIQVQSYPSLIKFFDRTRWYYSISVPVQFYTHLKMYGFDLPFLSLEKVIDDEYCRYLIKRGKTVRRVRRYLADNNLTFSLGSYLCLDVPPQSKPLRIFDHINAKFVYD